MSSKSFETIIDQIGKLTVLELAELVKEMEKTFGVSSAMPAMGASAGAAAPAASAAPKEEKSEFKVTLKDGGPEKIKTIKALRSVTTLSLTDAKNAVEQAPTVIAEAASKDDAKKIKEALEAVGAVVELA